MKMLIVNSLKSLCTRKLFGWVVWAGGHLVHFWVVTQTVHPRVISHWIRRTWLKFVQKQCHWIPRNFTHEVFATAEFQSWASYWSHVTSKISPLHPVQKKEVLPHILHWICCWVVHVSPWDGAVLHGKRPSLWFQGLERRGWGTNRRSLPQHEGGIWSTGVPKGVLKWTARLQRRDRQVLVADSINKA